MAAAASPDESLIAVPFDTDIHYCICIPDSGLADFTFFQGFAPGLLNMTWAMRMIATLPIDLRDPAQPRVGRIARRMAGAGAWRWMILNTSTLVDLPISPVRPFWVMFSADEGTAAAIAAHFASALLPPLHISTREASGAVHPSEVGLETIRQHVHATLPRLGRAWPDFEMEPVRAEVERWYELDPEILPLPYKAHPITFPNRVVADSMRFEFRVEGAFHADTEDQYAPVMAESAGAILALRDGIPPMISGLLSPDRPALMLHAPAENRATTARPLGKRSDKDARALFDVQQMLRRQRGFLVPLDAERQERIGKSGPAQGAWALRRAELAVHAHLIALAAASTFSATIRMPPAVNRVYGTAAALGNHARTASERRPARMARLFATVQARLRSAVGDEALALIEKVGGGGIKLVTDAPVEWLPVGKLPLGLRYDVSRINAVPGNHMAMQLFLSHSLRLRPADLRKVLLLTSYEAKDRIRTLLTDRLARVAPNWEGNLDVETVAVASLEEFREALARYDGAIMIFDGHGRHPEGDTALGKLMIAGQEVDVWDQRGDLKVPPIVILSACDTHGPDRSHNSITNGFLSCGARTVLSTLLPIDAVDAADFVARLLLRIANGIEPIIAMLGRSILWSEVVGGMLRMKLSTDLATPLMHAGRLAPHAYRDLRTEANMRINLRQDDWLDWQLGEMARHTGMTGDELDRHLAQVLAVSDTIRYAQMGNPETIVIGALDDLPAASRAEFLED